MSVRSKIFGGRIAEEKQVSLPPLDDNLLLHEARFDWLAFAMVIARLEDDLGSDAFVISVDAPVTVGDFVRAYKNVFA
jgi:hypothetical protein